MNQFVICQWTTRGLEYFEVTTLYTSPRFFSTRCLIWDIYSAYYAELIVCKYSRRFDCLSSVMWVVNFLSLIVLPVGINSRILDVTCKSSCLLSNFEVHSEAPRKHYSWMLNLALFSCRRRGVTSIHLVRFECLQYDIEENPSKFPHLQNAILFVHHFSCAQLYRCCPTRCTIVPYFFKGD